MAQAEPALTTVAGVILAGILITVAAVAFVAWIILPAVAFPLLWRAMRRRGQP